MIAGAVELPEPMLARAVDRLPERGDLPGGTWYEPKWDGFRVLAHVEGGRCWLRSRRGADLSEAFPEIVAALRAQLDDVVLDGELVVWNDGRLDFSALQRRMTTGRRAIAEAAATTPANVVLFDVLASGGVDLRDRPYLERRQRLEVLSVDPPLSITPATDDPDEAMRWYHRYAAAGVEGLVAKGAAQPYLDGTRGWRKLRHRRTTEALVGAVDGRLGHPTRLVLAAWDDEGSLRVVGATSVLSSDAAAEVGARLSPAGAEHPWPEELAGHLLGSLAGQRRDVEVERAAPDTVVEVEVDTAFDRGRWRHPVRYRRIRTDLEPRSITTDHIRQR